ncbi:MAG: SIR2 family protein [Vicinamibacterales bacterium]
MSLFAGYPSWQGLCSEVREYARPPQPASALSPTFAAFLEHYSEGDWLRDYLRRRFAPPQHDVAIATSPLARMCHLRSGIIVTTNYDPLLELALAPVLDDIYTGSSIDEQTYKQLFAVDSRASSPVLIKLHGSFELDRGLVATSRQYHEAYSQPGLVRQLLTHLMTCRSMVFFGCSLADEDAPTRILADLRFRLGHFAQEHFAFRRLAGDADEESRLSALGVQAIFYDSSHDEFYSSLVDELASPSLEHSASAVPDSARIDLSGSPFALLEWVFNLPAPDSLSEHEWTSLRNRVSAKRLGQDLLVTFDALGNSLNLVSILGDLVETDRKTAAFSVAHPSRDVHYLFPEREFAKEPVRVLRISFDSSRQTLSVFEKQRRIASARLQGLPAAAQRADLSR